MLRHGQGYQLAVDVTKDEALTVCDSVSDPALGDEIANIGTFNHHDRLRENKERRGKKRKNTHGTSSYTCKLLELYACSYCVRIDVYYIWIDKYAQVIIQTITRSSIIDK